MTDSRICLHRIAPWSRTLPQGSGNRWVQVGDRRFHAERSGGMYTIYEVGDDGMPLGWETAHAGGRTDKAKLEGVMGATFVAIAFNLPQVVAAIAMRLDGKSEDEIRRAVHAMPSAGTGRNSPKNVERRRSWR